MTTLTSLTNITITLDGQPYLEGGTCRLPTEEGRPSIFVMGDAWYEAEATDAAGNCYLVLWDILDSFDPAADDDETSACDWDNPRCIVTWDDNGREYDVTAKIAQINF